MGLLNSHPLCRRKRYLVVSVFIVCNCACVVFINLFCSPDKNPPVETPFARSNEQLLYTFETNLLILVLVSPNSVESRSTIRQTWASNMPFGALIKFIIGAKDIPVGALETLRAEEEENGDVVLIDDFKESYHNLTRKLLLSLVWASSNVKFNYLLKGDEDSFIRIDKVLLELKNKPLERFYWGFFDGRAHVKKSGKYREKNYVLCDRYLPYALGGGYVISSDLVRYVARNADYLQLYNNEDVSLGTWLAPLEIIRSHDQRFDTEYKSRGCFNSYLITHKKGLDEMREMYLNLQNINRLCSKEVKVRNSYDYNWTVEPSKCCDRKYGFV